MEELSKFSFNNGVAKILKAIFVQNFSIASNSVDDERKILQNKLIGIERRIEKDCDMFIEDKLDEEDFRSIKNKYKTEIENLKAKLNALRSSTENNNFEQRINQALDSITNISERYKNANTIDKRAIVGLVYPEKLIFDGENFQTTKINSFANSIFLIKKELGNKKTDKEVNYLLMSVL
ncbi:hypothetical protein [Chryseobacterium sp.]|uniref:hypothetical protein n=1 Tax=Chryseobacterium sp. TaxID=1871047 RepID=UPI0028A25554|nr:hypothetical protein [Chryseobacterium sp.]